MNKRNIKTDLAQKIVKAATYQAHHTVGRSWPLGTHEVEVPKELQQYTEKHEED